VPVVGDVAVGPRGHAVTDPIEGAPTWNIPGLKN